MKVKTVGWMAALGMVLSSVSVWSLTKPKGPGLTTTADSALTAPIASPTDVQSQFQIDGPLQLSGRLGHGTLLVGKQAQSYLLTTVVAKAGLASRQPLNLAVVLDRSGSMKGRRMDNALASARDMIRRLSDGDVLTIIAYDTTTDQLLPPTRIDGSSRERALSALANVQAKGDTCISCGIDAGMAALRQNSGMVDRILLLSDGEPTSGIKDLAGFRTLAASARAMGCAVSSVGVDVEYNERVLSALALESNGTHYFAETPTDVANAFDKELATLSKTTAKDVEVRIRLQEGVQLDQVVDRAFRREGNEVVVPLGSFSESEEKTVLLRIAHRPEGGVRMPIAKVELSYDGPRGTRERASGQLEADLTTDPNLVAPLDGVVEARLTRTESADALLDANRAIATGDLRGAEEKLQRALQGVRSKRKSLAARSPVATKSRVDQDLANQEGALDKAARELGNAPAGDSERTNKVQQKKNVEASNPFRL
ncbi:MAG: VWA domain-containing protein [Polyangiaceae bacterium]